MATGLGHTFADLLMACKYKIGSATLVTSSGLIAVPVAPYYAMLHKGDPGVNGTANTCNSARRVLVSGVSSGQMVSSGTPDGQVESTGDTAFLSASDNATVTNVTIWAGTGAATNPGGVLVHSGPCVGSYSINDNPTIFAGDFTDAAVVTA